MHTFILIYTHIICNSTITSAPGHEHVIMDSYMIKRQVSLGHTWCLILSLLSVWSSPLYDMSVCLLMALATAVIRISY